MSRAGDALDRLTHAGLPGGPAGAEGLAHDRDADREAPTDAPGQVVVASDAEVGALAGRVTADGSLEELVALIPALAVGARRETVLRVVRQRVTASEGRAAGVSLGRAITKQLDWVAGQAELTTGGPGREALQEARCQLAVLLATRCAAALRAAADELDHYGPAAAGYARTKADVEARLKRKEKIPPSENLVAARRREREAQRARVGAALTDAWLAASGGETDGRS